MRKILFAFLFLTICPWLAAQALNNDSIIKMAKAGLSDEVIVSTVQSSNGSFDTSADGLIALKTAGVSDKVIGAMVVKGSGAAPSPVAATGSAADPNDPQAAHDPGIYILGTEGKLVLIERAGTGHSKTANVWGAAFSYGIAKAKVKSEIPGARAQVRTKETKPVFYMYFPPSGNLGATDTISSPTQFTLLSLEEKKDHRETTVAKMGLGSASMGNDEKRSFKFKVEKIRPYAYKVTPENDLKIGEFAFIASTGSAGAASSTSVAVFDFGID